MTDRQNILKDSPDYEDYTVNEARLSTEEMRQLGLLTCGGCCSTKGGCSTKKSCCKKK